MDAPTKINGKALKAVLDEIGTTTVRVQPVKPADSTPGELIWQLLGSIVALLLGAWFVCLGTLAAHDYWPGVPALPYWATVAMLLGLQTVAHNLRGPAWKWARR